MTWDDILGVAGLSWAELAELGCAHLLTGKLGEGDAEADAKVRRAELRTVATRLGSRVMAERVLPARPD